MWLELVEKGFHSRDTAGPDDASYTLGLAGRAYRPSAFRQIDVSRSPQQTTEGRCWISPRRTTTSGPASSSAAWLSTTSNYASMPACINVPGHRSI